MTAALDALALRWDQGRITEMHSALTELATREPRTSELRAALALCLSEEGLQAEARALIGHIATDPAPPPASATAWVVCAHVAVSTSARETAAVMRDRLASCRDETATSATGFWGALDHARGAIAGTLGQPREAATLLASAAALYDRLEKPAWMARAAVDEAGARLLLGQREEGSALLEKALSLAEGAGAQSIARRALTLLSRERAADELARSPVGLQVRLRSPARLVSPGQPTIEAPLEPTLIQRGDVWELRAGARSVHLRDAKGVRYLARLIATPGSELHALDLQAEGMRARVSPVRTTSGELTVHAAEADTGPLIDREARRAYAGRLDQLREEAKRACRLGDARRAARAREESEAIATQLARATGLGGRDRIAATNAERARTNVSRAVRRAIAEVQDLDAEMGAHLGTAVVTGTFCSYAPPKPPSPIRAP